MNPDDTLKKLISDLRLTDAVVTVGRTFHEGRLTESEFTAKLADLGVSGRAAELEVFYNHPNNREWKER
jgi:hypothetical protein